MEKIVISIFTLFLIISPFFISTETKTFINEYTCQASEPDSRAPSRITEGISSCSKRMEQRVAALVARDWDTLLNMSKEYIAYCKNVSKPSIIAEAYDSMSVAYHEMGKYKESIAACDDGIKISYKEPSLHFNKARSLLKSGRMNEAMKSFKIAEKLAEHGIDVAKDDIEHLDKNLHPQVYEASKTELMAKIRLYKSILEVVVDIRKTIE